MKYSGVAFLLILFLAVGANCVGVNFFAEVDSFPGHGCENAVSHADFFSVVRNLTTNYTNPWNGTVIDDVVMGSYAFYFILENSTAEAHTISISTSSPQTDFDTQIFVWEGSCQAKAAVAANDDESGSQQSSYVEIQRRTNVSYIIAVSGDYDYTGQFNITVSDNLKKAANGTTCELAFEVDIPTTPSVGEYYFNTQNLTAEYYNPFSERICDGISIGYYAYFYKLYFPSEMIVAVSTNFTETDFDTELVVYSGSHCGSLSCVVGDDDINGTSNLKSYAEFYANADSYYFVVVSGKEGDIGHFRLAVETPKTKASVGRTCITAIPFPCNSSCSFSGSISYDFENPWGGKACIGGITLANYAMYYNFTAISSGLVVFTTIQESTEIDTQIFAYEGSCDTKECIAANTNTCIGCNASYIEVMVETGKNYIVVVTSDQQGNFGLQYMKPAPAPAAGTTCENPIVIQDDASVLNSLTTKPWNTMEDVECDSLKIGRYAHFYRYTAAFSHYITISTNYTETNFDTALFLFKNAANCSGLVCLASNDDHSSSSKSMIEHRVEVGDDLLIVVTGFRDFWGDYKLTLTNSSVPYGSECENPYLETINVGESFTETNNITDKYVTIHAYEKCWNQMIQPYSKFYKFEFTFSGVVGFSTDFNETDFDTMLLIFEGDCDALTCITSNDDTGPDKHSYVELDVVPGIEYMLVVSGYANSTGRYKLSLYNPVPFEPLGYRCSEAMELEYFSLVDLPNTYHNPLSGLTCDGNSVGAYAHYYAFELNETVGVYISTEFGAYTQFDTQLFVFKIPDPGDVNCNNLACVVSIDDDSETSEFSTLFYVSQPGSYILIVSGFAFDYGQYALYADFSEPIPDGKSCITAKNWTDPSPGSSMVGNVTYDFYNEFATNNVNCRNLFVAPYADFFEMTFSSDVSVVPLTTDYPETTMNTKLFVFEGGDCNNPVCITSNDDFSEGHHSYVEFEAHAGVPYIVVVAGQWYDVGQYKLGYRSSPLPSPEGTRCENAFSLDDWHDTVTYLNACDCYNPYSDESCSGVFMGHYAHYYLWENPLYPQTVTPAVYASISTMFPETEFDTQISVYTGASCDLMSCYTANDDYDFSQRGSLVDFPATEPQYLIVVSGWNFEHGDYRLKISEGEHIPEGEDCTTSYDFQLELVDVIGELSTDYYSPLAGSVCNEFSLQPYTKWYSFVYNGSSAASIAFSTEDPYTNFDTQIFVLQGSCSAIQCVTASNDWISKGKSSLAMFTAIPGQSYHVVVSGSTLEEIGVFNLKYMATPPSFEDGSRLETAWKLLVGSTVTKTLGNDTFNPMYNSMSCQSVSQDSSYAHFYRFDSQSETILIASTDFAETTFDTKIFVHDGSAGNVTCVAANDNVDTGKTTSAVEFVADAGRSYFIEVSSSGVLPTGQYKLSLEGNASATNCLHSLDLLKSAGGVKDITGEFLCPISGEKCQTLTVGQHAHWYYILGSRHVTYKVSVVEDTFDVGLFVWSGSCDSLECVSSSAGEIEIAVIPNEAKFLLVSGMGSQVGTYKLSVVEVPVYPRWLVDLFKYWPWVVVTIPVFCVLLIVIVALQVSVSVILTYIAFRIVKAKIARRRADERRKYSEMGSDKFDDQQIAYAQGKSAVTAQTDEVAVEFEREPTVTEENREEVTDNGEGVKGEGEGDSEQLIVSIT